MTNNRWPTQNQHNNIFGGFLIHNALWETSVILDLFFFSFLFFSLTSYGFWFCIYRIFLSIQMCVSLHLYMIFMIFFGSYSSLCLLVLNYSELFLFCNNKNSSSCCFCYYYNHHYYSQPSFVAHSSLPSDKNESNFFTHILKCPLILSIKTCEVSLF